MKQLRTFVALEVPSPVRALAAEVQQRLRADLQDVRWSHPENIHLTLKFLGDVPEIELPDVCDAVRRAAGEHESLVWRPAELGAFPQLERPRVLWLGVTPEEEGLFELQQSIDRSLHEIGFPAERRRFHAHLTLGRCRRAQELPADHFQATVQWLAAAAKRLKLEVHTSEVATFASFLEPEGPRYQAIGHAALGKR